jgi:hypothetical protein
MKTFSVRFRRNSSLMRADTCTELSIIRIVDPALLSSMYIRSSCLRGQPSRRVRPKRCSHRWAPSIPIEPAETHEGLVPQVRGSVDGRTTSRWLPLAGRQFPWRFHFLELPTSLTPPALCSCHRRTPKDAGAVSSLRPRKCQTIHVTSFHFISPSETRTPDTFAWIAA